MSDVEIAEPLAREQPTPEELIQGAAKQERLGAWYATAILPDYARRRRWLNRAGTPFLLWRV